MLDPSAVLADSKKAKKKPRPSAGRRERQGELSEI